MIQTLTIVLRLPIFAFAQHFSAFRYSCNERQCYIDPWAMFIKEFVKELIFSFGFQ